MSIIIDPWFCSSPINLHLMKDNNITDNWLFVWSKGYLKGGLSSDRTYIFCSGCCHIKISKFNIIERYGIDRNFLSKYYKNSHVFLTLQSWWLTNQTLFDFFYVIYNIFLTTGMKLTCMEKTTLVRLTLHVRLFRDFLERADLMPDWSLKT